MLDTDSAFLLLLFSSSLETLYFFLLPSTVRGCPSLTIGTTKTQDFKTQQRQQQLLCWMCVWESPDFLTFLFPLSLSHWLEIRHVKNWERDGGERTSQQSVRGETDLPTDLQTHVRTVNTEWDGEWVQESASLLLLHCFRHYHSFSFITIHLSLVSFKVRNSSSFKKMKCLKSDKKNSVSGRRIILSFQCTITLRLEERTTIPFLRVYIFVRTLRFCEWKAVFGWNSVRLARVKKWEGGGKVHTMKKWWA